KGIAARRAGAGKRARDRKRTLGREARKPRELLLERQFGPGPPREADDHVLAETVERVVGAPRLDGRQSKAGPLRKCARDKARDEPGVDRLLVRVHSWHVPTRR